MREKFNDVERLVFTQILLEQGPQALDNWLDSLSPQPTDQCVIEQIAKLHAEHNLFDILVGVRDSDIRPTLNLLLKAAQQLDSYTMRDVISLFRFAKELDTAFLFQVEEAIEHILKQSTFILLDILDELRTEDLLNSISCLLWAEIYSKSFRNDVLGHLHAAVITNTYEPLIRVALFINLSPSCHLAPPEYREIAIVLLPDIQNVVSEFPGIYAGWRAMCLAAEFSDEAAFIIKKIPSSNNNMAQTALLFWMAERSRAAVTTLNTPISDLLLPMAKVALSNDQIKHTFEVAFSRLLRQEVSTSETQKILRHLLDDGVNLPSTFGLIMQAIAENSVLFQKFFSEWIMSTRASSDAVRSMIAGCIAGRYPCKIDGTIFQEADISGRKRAAMRLLAWTHNAPCLMKFAEDFAEDPVKQPDGLILADAIITHLVEEYPMSSPDWLKSKAAGVGRARAKELYKHHRDRAVQFRTALKQLPDLPELAPTSQQQLAMRQREVRNQRQIGETARENSIFSRMANRVNVMQGKRVATVMPDGTVSISGMAEFSFSIELPVSERADPVGALINRIDYLVNAQ